MYWNNVDPSSTPSCGLSITSELQFIAWLISYLIAFLRNTNLRYALWCRTIYDSTVTQQNAATQGGVICVVVFWLQSSFSQLGNSGNSAISIKAKYLTSVKMYVERKVFQKVSQDHLVPIVSSAAGLAPIFLLSCYLLRSC